MARIKIGNVRTPIDYLREFFAPSGSGLGKPANYEPHPQDIDAVFKSGYYLLTQETAGTTTDILHVLARSETDCVQERFSTFDNGRRRRYTYTGSKGWSEWEWDNPPMNIGVEYRTTERFKGKPVYRKIVPYNLPTSTNTDFSVPHGISNFDTLVRQTASVGAGVPLPYTHNGNTTCVKELDATNIKVSNSGQSWDTSYTWNFYLYYTKTTD